MKRRSWNALVSFTVAALALASAIVGVADVLMLLKSYPMPHDARVIIYNGGTALLMGAWLWLGRFRSGQGNAGQQPGPDSQNRAVTEGGGGILPGELLVRAAAAAAGQ